MEELKAAKAILSRSLFVPLEMIDDDAEIAGIKPLDSLAFESLVLEIERHVGREFDVLLLFDVRSVGDLARLLDRLR